MMTFYAAAGSYQIRSEDGKNMPYIGSHCAAFFRGFPPEALRCDGSRQAFD